MLTTLSDEPNKFNRELQNRITHLALDLDGYTFPVTTDKGVINYCSEDTREPIVPNDRSDIRLFHVLDSAATDTGVFKQETLTYAIICNSKITGVDQYLKALLEDLKPKFLYVGAEYTHSTILNTYNIPNNFFNFEKMQLFVIRYQVRAAIPNLNCVELCCS